MQKNHRWLLGELETWLDEGLIEPHQADALEQRYASGSDGIGLGRLMLSALGAIIFGLGVILFFAYNWDDMTKLTKLAVVFSALVASHGAGWWLTLRDRAPRTQVEALHLLGTMLFGAGIWLISQIYHFDNPYPGALLAWGLGALVLAWALPSLPQAFVALGLIVAWGLDRGAFHRPDADYLAPALIAFGILPLAFRQRSRVMLFFGGAAFLLMLPFGAVRDLDSLVLFLLFFLAASYFGAALLARDHGRNELDPTAILGQIVYFVLLFVVTFEQAVPDIGRSAPETLVQWALYLGPFTLAAYLLARPLFFVAQAGGRRYTRRFADRLDLGTAMATLAGVVLFAALPWMSSELAPVLIASLFNLLFIAHGALLIFEGSSRQSWQRATAGCLLISAVTMARFTDLFESLLSRSAAFLLLGLGLFAVGQYYRNRGPAPAEPANPESKEAKEADHA